jgi:uncharacterized membrane protein
MTARLILACLGTLVTFCALDLVWLGFIAKPFYQAQVGSLLLARPNLAAAALLYVLCAAGLVGFVVLPALDAASVWRAVIAGAIFGFVVYGVYDLTNLAMLKGWTVSVAAADMAWGAVVSGAAAAAGYAAGRLADTAI